MMFTGHLNATISEIPLPLFSCAAAMSARATVISHNTQMKRDKGIPAVWQCLGHARYRRIRGSCATM